VREAAILDPVSDARHVVREDIADVRRRKQRRDQAGRGDDGDEHDRKCQHRVASPCRLRGRLVIVVGTPDRSQRGRGNQRERRPRDKQGTARERINRAEAFRDSHDRDAQQNRDTNQPESCQDHVSPACRTRAGAARNDPG
jgi:hypothetical protein